MASRNAGPLSDEELAELDAFLLSDACDDDTLAIDEAHGYLTARVVEPDAGADDDWLEVIWGAPRFADDAEAQRMTSLLARLREDIAASLAGGRAFEPLVIEEEDEQGTVYEAYEGWCFGFMLAVEQAQHLWEGLPSDQQALLTPIAQLALLATDEEPEMDEAEYDDWVELLPGAVAGLYRYWRAARN